MKSKIILLSLLIFSQVYLAQTKKTQKFNLQDTYWKADWLYGNAGTSRFVKLSEKQKPNSGDFLIFHKGNRYEFGRIYHETCGVLLSGNYTVQKSHIIFDDKVVKVTKKDEKCSGVEEFRLGKKAIIMKGANLYLTRPSDWYDEPVKKSGDTVILYKGQLGRFDTDEGGKYRLTDANAIPFDDGTYKFSSDEGQKPSVIFSIKNGFLDGNYIADSKDRKIQYVYREGTLLSEKRWGNKKLYYEKTNLEKVEKQSSDFIITLTEIKKNLSKNEKDSIITTYRNKTPETRKRFQDGDLVAEKDFVNNTFKKYSNSGKILESESSGLKIEYDYDGQEKTRKVYEKNGFKLYRFGTLREEKIYSNDDIKTMTYDAKGNLLETETEKRSNIVSVEGADPDKFVRNLTEEQLSYYKGLVK